MTWLYDRYELTTEDKLLVCWVLHPGLVEELRALRQWRLEIYNGQPGGGQAARYWHTEMRAVLQAAASMYAGGCRAGHRGAPRSVHKDRKMQERWAQTDLAAGIPPADIVAGRARRSGGWTSPEQMAAAYDEGAVTDLPGLGEHVMYAGAWWSPAAAGWYGVPGPPIAGDPWSEPDGGGGDANGAAERGEP